MSYPTIEEVKRAASQEGAEPLYTQSWWRAALRVVLTALGDSIEVRPIKEWHDDTGAVLWWEFPICEPPWCGRPDDDDWPGYHTHWTPIAMPEVPT